MLASLGIDDIKGRAKLRANGEESNIMGGWDNDKSGDYVPKPPPVWFWVIVSVIIVGLMALAISSRF